MKAQTWYRIYGEARKMPAIRLIFKYMLKGSTGFV